MKAPIQEGSFRLRKMPRRVIGGVKLERNALKLKMSQPDDNSDIEILDLKATVLSSSVRELWYTKNYSG